MSAEKCGRTSREVQEHLRSHLTDGSWHDSCPYCLDRRKHGGTGVLPEGGGS